MSIPSYGVDSDPSLEEIRVEKRQHVREPEGLYDYGPREHCEHIGCYLEPMHTEDTLMFPIDIENRSVHRCTP